MSAQLQVSGEAKIRDIQGPVVANSGVITALDGAASQYVRGDGTLADFPTQTGGGSSVSYYLNGSVNQGTFGGSTYYQMSKNAITGTGTNFSTSADGLLAQFITDANDPDATSIPSGNWNIEFFMNVSAASGALASFYVEFYKYNGTTFTLVATNVATPEVLTGTTTIDAYYTSVAFPETALLQTDRLAIRIYANVASKTVTLYTEDNRLCQVVTTFSRGILSLNNLTDQQQYFAVGTSGSDFNIVSSLDTHTFNIPTASATKRGLLSSTDWSTFNNKVPYTGATGNVDLGENSLLASFISANGSIGVSGTISLKQNGSVFGGTGEVTIGSATAGELSIFFGNNSYKATFLNTSLTASRIYTLPNITGTLALLEGNQNFIGFKQFSDTNSTWLDYGISMAKGSTPSSLSSSRVNVYSNSGDKNLVIADTFASFAKLQFQATGDLTYTFPSSSGTIALTSDLSAYVTLATTQTISGAKTFSATPVFDNGVSGMPLRFKTYGAIGLGVSGYTDIAAVGTTSLGFAFGVSASATKLAYFAFGDISDNIGRTYTFPNADGTIALTSNLSAYVTLATNQTISGQKTFTQNLLLDGNGSNAGTLLLKSNTALPTSIGYTSINSTTNSIYLTTFVSNPKTAALDLSGLSDNAVRTFTFPNTSGTIALTSNLSSYLPLTGGTLTGALSGTSATFSNNIGVGFSPIITSGGAFVSLYIGASGQGGTLFGQSNATSIGLISNGYYDASNLLKYINSVEGIGRLYNYNGELIFSNAPIGTSGSTATLTERFRIASTGAATFSGSVTTNGNLINIRGGDTYLFFTENGVADKFLIGSSAGSNDLVFRSNAYNLSQGNERMRITSGGNVGIGTTSPVYKLVVSNSGAEGIEFIPAFGSNINVIQNYNRATSTWGTLDLRANDYVFRNQGTAALTISSTGAAIFSNSVTAGQLIVSAPATTSYGSLNALTNGYAYQEYKYNSTAYGYIGQHSAFISGASGTDLAVVSVNNLIFGTSGAFTERMRITSGGGVGIGATSVTGTYKLRVINSSAVQGDPIFASDNNVYNSILVYAAGADGYNGAATVMIMGRNTSTGRSLNAGGTINAMGLDYAEYMTKAIEEDILKGDIVGVDENGLLTNIFLNAKSFVVKSTNPSYVGGDSWGSVDNIGKLKEEPTDEEIAEHESKLQAARVNVDRIAFSGQVPCNVYNANVGDYIIPIEVDGKISGQAVSNPTFEQYQISVGKVWKIMEDGRAWIAVKIG